MSSIPSGIRAPSKSSQPKLPRASTGRSDSIASVSRSSSVSTLASSIADGKDGLDERMDFSIGDRVWVNGSKPGTLQYIGKTDFAPGIWAGIALDEADGKNNGTINDRTYFVCEPQKGIFIRPHRLTKEAGSPPNLSGDALSKPRENVPAVRSLLTKAPATPRNALTSPSRSFCSKLKVGDRVVVSSITGQKSGILRYLGTTDFATGEWAGIELDSPLGKNDGSVGGRRYFSCLMKHGLFAPVNKVYREGSSLSQTPSLAGSVRNRSYSRESLNSSTSSVASSKARSTLGGSSVNKKSPKSPNASTTLAQAAMHDALKEKQEHIEQLLKERDLDRQEVVKAASQVEKMEQQLNVYQHKYESAIQENSKMTSLKEQVEQVETEKKQLMSLLDEEKSKLEDLQFRLEEEIITKGDLEAQVEKERAKIQELEAIIAAANKDSISEIIPLKESLEAYKTKEQKSQLEIEKLKESLQTKEKELAEISVQLEQQHETIKNSKDELEKQIQNLRNDKEAILKEACEKEKYLKSELGRLEVIKKEFELNNQDLVKNLKNREENIAALQSQIEDAKRNIEILSQGSSQQVSELQKHISQLEQQMENLRAEMKEKELQITQEATSLSQEKIKLESDIYNLRALLENKNRELEKFTLDFEKIKNEKSQMVSEKISLQTEIQELMSEIQGFKISMEKKENNFNDQLKTLVEEKNQVEIFKQELLQNLDFKENELSKLKSEFHIKNVELENEISKLQSVIADMEKNISSSSHHYKESEQRLKTEIEALTKDKAQLEITKQELLNNLSAKDNDLNKLNLELGDAVTKAMRIDELEALTLDLRNQLENINSEKKELLLKSTEKDQIYSTLSEKEKLYQTQLVEAQSALNKVLKEKEESVQNLEAQLKHLTQSLEQTQIEFQKKQNEAEKLKSSLEEKENQITELAQMVTHSQSQLGQLKLQNDSNLTLMESRIAEFKIEQEKHFVEKEKKLCEEIEKLNSSLSEKDSSYQELLSNLTQIKSKEETLEKEISRLQQQLSSANDEKNLVITSQVTERENFTKQMQLIKEQFEQQNNKELKAVQEEIRNLTILLKEKEQELKNKCVEIETLTQSNESLKEEFNKLQLLLKDGDEKDSKLIFEKNQKENLAKQLETFKAEYNKLKSENEEVITQMKIAQSSCQELENFKETLMQKNISQEAAIIEREQKLNALQHEIERMQKEFTEHKEALQKKLNISEKEKSAMNEFKIQLDLQHSVFEELQQRLEESENSKAQLSQQLETKFKEELKQWENKFQDVQKLLNKTELKLTDEKNINISIQKQLESKELLLQLQNEEIEKLKLDSVETNVGEIMKLKNQVSKLQEENDELSKKLQIQKSTPNDELEISGDHNALKEKLEEKISQINFLNSIIVDMKKKNAELTEKLESPSMEKDVNLNGVKAPRLFCDICDMFDLHDTEDCPKQCSVEEEVPHSKHNGKRKEERPYCYNCEVFGHWTIDCDHEETF